MRPEWPGPFEEQRRILTLSDVCFCRASGGAGGVFELEEWGGAFGNYRCTL